MEFCAQNLEISHFIQCGLIDSNNIFELLRIVWISLKDHTKFRSFFVNRKRMNRIKSSFSFRLTIFFAFTLTFDFTPVFESIWKLKVN